MLGGKEISKSWGAREVPFISRKGSTLMVKRGSMTRDSGLEGPYYTSEGKKKICFTNG